jgi:hypothetical protein
VGTCGAADEGGEGAIATQEPIILLIQTAEECLGGPTILICQAVAADLSGGARTIVVNKPGAADFEITTAVTTGTGAGNRGTLHVASGSGSDQCTCGVRPACIRGLFA